MCFCFSEPSPDNNVAGLTVRIFELVSCKCEQYISMAKRINVALEQTTKIQRVIYSSTFSLTSALGVVGGQRHAPAALRPGKTRYLLYRRLGGPQGRSGWLRKISPPLELDSLTVQSVASRYTD